MKENRTVIIISGKQYSGKDTIAKMIQDELPNFQISPLARGIKEEFAEIKNITPHEVEMNKPIYRAELIVLGNKHRDEDPDYWIKRVINKEGDIIVSDLRLKHEYDVFKKHGAVSIRVNADRDERTKRGTLVKEDDKTETDLDDIKDWDFVVENSGDLEKLKAKASEIIKAVKSKK